MIGVALWIGTWIGVGLIALAFKMKLDEFRD